MKCCFKIPTFQKIESILNYCLWLFILPCSNILNADTYLAPGSVQGNEGDVVQVPIYFETNESIVGADIILQFDDTVLQLGEILPGNSITDHQIYDDQDTNGELKLTILSMTNNSLLDGNLSLLSFLLLESIPEAHLLVTVDFEKSLFIAETTEPFEISPILPISDLNLSFPVISPDETLPRDQEILFSVHSDSSMASYSWSMGDNSAVIEGNSTLLYSYDKPGKYLVTVYANNILGAFEKSFEISVDEPFWQFNAEDLGYGWKSFDWFGAYYQAPETNWLFHLDLGWLYRVGERVDDTWFWSEGKDWLWIDANLFPYMYSDINNDWLYIVMREDREALVFDYSDSTWVLWSDLSITPPRLYQKQTFYQI